MSIFQYPDLGYFNIVNSNSAELGSYQLTADGDLGIANLRVYNKKAGSFSYQLRLVISQRQEGPEIAASNWETFSNETIGQTGENWLGDLTFTFLDYALKGSDPYYIRIETTGYTRLGDDAYLGVWLDWGFGKSWIAPVGVAASGGARIALGVNQ
jgi:hypothetical protein